MTRLPDVARDANHLPTGDPSSMVFVRTLGAASIDAGVTRLTPSSVRKFALLFYLWAERGRSVTRATLHDLVFPDQTAPNARHSIRELIYQFRKLGARIASEGETVELAPESVRADYSDVLRQERPSLEQLRAATGGFMPGYAPAHSEAFTEWLEGLRARATVELNRVFVAELNRARRLGDWTLVEAAAQAVLALDPLHEEATFATAEMLAINGAKAQAVRVLDKYVEEVGKSSPDLKLPATLLRRRISERSREIYRAPLTLPFLGRDAEMAALQERFARAKAGEAQCVVIVGEPGIGKTRLAEELCTQAVLAGASVERVATQPYDVHRPMATFADLVPRLLELPGALGCSPESMAALKRLTRPESVDKQSIAETSEVIAAAIARAIADLIDSITGESPLLILVDDAQWTDERSRETLAALLAGRLPRRLMIVLTSRDRSMTQFLARRSEAFLGLSLAPLTSIASSELTNRSLLDQASTDKELRDWIASTSGGNPFFLKCLISHYQTTGERFVVPPSLSILLDQKISALSTNATLLLGTCVALARHSDLERVLRALELGPIDVQAAAGELESANLVLQSGRRIEPAHSLVAEAIARLMPPLVRRLIHRRVACVLELEAQASVSAALLWDCAEHWGLAGEPERASEFLARCAATAMEIGRPREAAQLLLRAAEMIGRQPAIDLARRSVEIADGSHEGDLVKRGIGLLRKLGVRIEGDPLELAELHALVCEWDDPEHASERLQSWVVSAKPLAQRVRAAADMLVIAETDFRPEIAQQVYASLICDLAASAQGIERQSLTLLLIYHCSFGDLNEAHRIASQLVRSAESATSTVAADIYRKCGVAFWRLGLTEEALHAFEQCYLRAKRVGLLKLQVDSASALMGLQLDISMQGVDYWRQTAESAIAEDCALASRPTYILTRLDFACCTGNLDDARTWLEAAQRLSESSRLIRIQRWVRAAELRLRQLSGDGPSIEEVKVLLDRHRPNTEVSDIGDFEMAVVTYTFAEHSEFELARQLLARYFGVNRRSRAPLTNMLRSAIDELNSKQGLARSQA